MDESGWVSEDDYNTLTDERDDLLRKIEELEAQIQAWSDWADTQESAADDLSRALSNRP